MLNKEFYNEDIMCRCIENCDILSICVKIEDDKLVFKLYGSNSNICYYIDNKFVNNDILKITTRGHDNINIFMSWLYTIQNVISNGDGGDGGITKFDTKELKSGKFRYYLDNNSTYFSSILCDLLIKMKGTSEPETFKSCCDFASLSIKYQLVENILFSEEYDNLDEITEKYRQLRHDILDFDINDEFSHIGC